MKVSLGEAPLLAQEGCPRLKGAYGVVTDKQSSGQRFGWWCVSDHPALRASPPVPGGELRLAERCLRDYSDRLLRQPGTARASKAAIVMHIRFRSTQERVIVYDIPQPRSRHT